MCFMRVSGGGNEPGDQLSPVQVSTAQDRFEILRTVEGQNSRPPDDWLNDRLAGPLSVQLSHRLEQFLDRLLGSGKLDGNHQILPPRHGQERG